MYHWFGQKSVYCKCNISFKFWCVLSAWIDCLLLFHFLFLLLFLFFLRRSLCFFYRDDPPRRFISIMCSRPGPCRISSPSWNAFGQLVKLVHNTVRGSSSGWLLQKLEIWLHGKNLWTATEQQFSAWMRKGYENPGRISWVYTFSATLSSLRNWAKHDRYWLRPSTSAQLWWSFSRL